MSGRKMARIRYLSGYLCDCRSASNHHCRACPDTLNLQPGVPHIMHIMFGLIDVTFSVTVKISYIND